MKQRVDVLFTEPRKEQRSLQEKKLRLLRSFEAIGILMHSTQK